MEPAPILYSVNEAAQHFMVPLRTLYNWINKGTVTTYPGGRCLQVDLWELDRLVNGNLDKAC